MFCAFGSVAADGVRAGLIPPECVILYPTDSTESLRVARHYAQARGVPMDHLVPVDVPIRTTVTRDQYNLVVVPTVRRFLESQPWGHTVRCLITSYDFPLRVAERHPTQDERMRADRLARRRGEVLLELERAAHSLESRLALAAGRAGPDPPLTENDLNISDKDMSRRIELIDALRRRIVGADGLLAKNPYPTFAQDALALLQLAGGNRQMLELLSANPGMLGEDSAEKLQLARQAVAMTQARIRDLIQLPRTDEQRDELYGLARQQAGAMAELMRLDDDVRALRGEATAAAMDSELALLWCDDVDPFKWHTNPAAIRQYAMPANPPPTPLPGRPAIMMVSRLDGPSVEIVERLIDASIAVEKRGLKGNFYIDARGLPGDDLYAVYDRDLLALAELVRGKSNMNVVLDTRPELFTRGQCPNTALYCGWYSPRRYVPALEFLPGSVGVHIASFELMSIKGGGPAYWCPGMLSDGVGATFGPTAEPYLPAFGRPSEFFGLLLTGEFTLVECFFYTNPFTSWKMALVGDPLYRPFAANPQLKIEDAVPLELLPLERIPPQKAASQPANP